MKLFDNKKGNFPDIPAFLTSALYVGLALSIAFLILINFNGVVKTNTYIPDVVKDGSDEFNNSFFKMDYVVVFILLGFVGFSIASARFIPSSSKFILIPIMSMILMPFIGFIVENIWYEFFNNSLVQTIQGNLFWTNLILDNLGFISIIYAFLVGISLASKQEVGQ